MKVLVTGSNGFIGNQLAAKLVADGHYVIGVDRTHGQLVQDLTVDQVAGVDVIFHLAATARVGVSLKSPEDVMNNNVTSTTKVLQFARDFGCRLVFVSSSSVRFADMQTNPYALSKKFGEDMVSLYRTTYGISGTTVRLFNVYGPGEADYGPFTTLVKQCQKGYLDDKGFTIFGDGSIVRDFTHVHDVVDGLMKIGFAEELAPLYEIGTGSASVTVRQVVEAFASGTSLKIEYLPGRFGDPQFTQADQSLRPHGWEPTRDIFQYIRDWKNSVRLDHGRIRKISTYA